MPSRTRVRQVRELLGKTQTDLGSTAHISQPRLSAIESGAPVTDQELQRLADATGFSSTFLNTEPTQPFPVGTIRFRKSSGTSAKSDAQAVRRLELAAEWVDRLSTGLRTPPVSLPFESSAAADIDDLATAARESMQLPPHGPIGNLTRGAERAGAVLVGLSMTDLPSTGRVRHHHGVSAWPDLDERPVIGFSTADPGDRQRHTIAHELGHLVLHRLGRSSNGRDLEAEASEFAGTLLMPTDDAAAVFADNRVTLSFLASLKEHWGISIAGLVMRARQVEAIDAAQLESLFKQLSARGWRKVEPVAVHREQPRLMQRLLEHNFGTPLDVKLAARNLGAPPHIVREFLCVADRDTAPGEATAAPVVDLAEARRQRRLSRASDESILEG
jgi:Zn-dependent peptidase ImmA (M78 family)/transcriptional regulator with XRE-family HTH domain